jgi:hypothetical protein
MDLVLHYRSVRIVIFAFSRLRWGQTKARRRTPTRSHLFPENPLKMNQEIQLHRQQQLHTHNQAPLLKPLLWLLVVHIVELEAVVNIPEPETMGPLPTRLILLHPRQAPSTPRSSPDL